LVPFDPQLDAARMSTLTCQRVSKVFDGVVAVQDVDLALSPGEIVGVIGPNGSGKSTLLSMMSGFYRPDSGSIALDGRVVNRAQAYRFRRMGVARTFQNARIFDDLTVRENVLAGLHAQLVDGPAAEWRWIPALLGTRAARRRDREANERCDEFIRTSGLSAVSGIRAGGCSYGQRKRIELARAMVGGPGVLLLDEPMAGIPVDGIDALVEQLILPARQAGVAIALVEHRVELILELCDRLVVLSAGRKIAEGLPRDVIAIEEVRNAYLGE
jgi:branched-chain amino acid transport system permease protein